MIRTQAGVYELAEEGRDGWNPEAFKERYSDILDKYDYIVGDWGYSQLRLRGFYENTNKKIPFEQKIAALDEYLQEFCNFGCAYFVLKRVRTFNGNPASGEQDAGQTQEFQVDITAESSSRYERKQNPRFDRQKNQRPRQERQDRSGRDQSQGDKTDKGQSHNQHQNQAQSQRPPRNEKDRPDKGFRGERPNRDRRNGQMANNRPPRDKVPTEVHSQSPRRFDDKK